MKRRSILKIGAASIFGLTLTDSIAAEQSSNKKAIIFVWLGGGASQIETFNPIPDAPIEFRSVTGYQDAGNGILLGGNFVNLSKLGKHLNVVHSFKHGDGNHNSATHWVLTSHASQALQEGSPQKEPSMGSIVSEMTGANTPEGLPTYIKISGITYDKSAWLGAKHLGYDITNNGISDLKLSIDKDRFVYRSKIVEQIEANNKVRGHKLAQEWSELRGQAANIVSGDISKVFELENESDATKNTYGIKNEFCKQLLLARRLVEKGSRFVSVAFHGWDMHGDIQAGFNNLGTILDQGLAALTKDLVDRGMDKDVLVIVVGEFGRTPKINATAGRDHHPTLSPLLFIGGDYQSGRIIGKSDDKAIEPTTNPFTPVDIMATVFDHMGLNPTYQKTDNSGRPRYLLDGGRCILG